MDIIERLDNEDMYVDAIDDAIAEIISLRKKLGLQPCGHPLSAIVTNGTTSYCGICADDSLRANIAAGVEA